jgi:hypothetical protein
MSSLEARARTLFWGLLVTLLAAGVFLAVVLAGVAPGVGTHEWAGLVLLGLLLADLTWAYPLRSLDRRPVWRVALALAALVVAGSLGATLATGALPLAWAGLPLVPLAVLLFTTADAARITHSIRRSRETR